MLRMRQGPRVLGDDDGTEELIVFNSIWDREIIRVLRALVDDDVADCDMARTDAGSDCHLHASRRADFAAGVLAGDAMNVDVTLVDCGSDFDAPADAEFRGMLVIADCCNLLLESCLGH